MQGVKTADNMHEQQAAPLKAGLYIVATPIGNLGDISKRALDILRSVDVIACEDTRVTAKLLNAFLIKKPMMAYHEHNGEQQRPKIEGMIREGKAVALVSDAGTPLISDPGYKLVGDLTEAGLYVTTIPGPSAVIAALTLAGLPTNRFLFLGFPPNKRKSRQDWFTREQKTNATLVFYESGRRLKESLTDARLALGDRKAAICREISKKFEEVVRGDITDLIEKLEQDGPPKGEIVVVIEGGQVKASHDNVDIDADALLEKALAHMSVKSASTFVAEVTGRRKKELYAKALDLAKK